MSDPIYQTPDSGAQYPGLPPATPSGPTGIAGNPGAPVNMPQPPQPTQTNQTFATGFTPQEDAFWNQREQLRSMLTGEPKVAPQPNSSSVGALFRQGLARRGIFTPVDVPDAPAFDSSTLAPDKLKLYKTLPPEAKALLDSTQPYKFAHMPQGEMAALYPQKQWSPIQGTRGAYLVTPQGEVQATGLPEAVHGNLVDPTSGKTIYQAPQNVTEPVARVLDLARRGAYQMQGEQPGGPQEQAMIRMALDRARRPDGAGNYTFIMGVGPDGKPIIASGNKKTGEITMPDNASGVQPPPNPTAARVDELTQKKQAIWDSANAAGKEYDAANQAKGRTGGTGFKTYFLSTPMAKEAAAAGVDVFGPRPGAPQAPQGSAPVGNGTGPIQGQGTAPGNAGNATPTAPLQPAPQGTQGANLPTASPPPPQAPAPTPPPPQAPPPGTATGAPPAAPGGLPPQVQQILQSLPPNEQQGFMKMLQRGVPLPQALQALQQYMQQNAPQGGGAAGAPPGGQPQSNTGGGQQEEPLAMSNEELKTIHESGADGAAYATTVRSAQRVWKSLEAKKQQLVARSALAPGPIAQRAIERQIQLFTKQQMAVRARLVA